MNALVKCLLLVLGCSLAAQALAQRPFFDLKFGAFQSSRQELFGSAYGLAFTFGAGNVRYAVVYDRMDEFVIFSEAWRINQASFALSAQHVRDKRRLFVMAGPSVAWGREGGSAGDINLPRFTALGGIVEGGIQHWFKPSFSLGLNASLKLSQKVQAAGVCFTIGFHI